jgi:hypothetical protein
MGFASTFTGLNFGGRGRSTHPLSVGACQPICKARTASPRAQAQSRDPIATKQPDGQITKTLSSPFAKNIPLNPSGKSVI